MGRKKLIQEKPAQEKDCYDRNLSKNDLFTLPKKVEKIDIDEYKITLFEKVMSGEERRQFNAIMANDARDETDTPKNIVPILIALCTVYEDGITPVFSFTDAEDIEEIKKMPSIITDKLFTVAARINGLTKEVIDEKVKN